VQYPATYQEYQKTEAPPRRRGRLKFKALLGLGMIFLLTVVGGTLAMTGMDVSGIRASAGEASPGLASVLDHYFPVAEEPTSEEADEQAGSDDNNATCSGTANHLATAGYSLSSGGASTCGTSVHGADDPLGAASGRTLAYWNALNLIMVKEVAMRTAQASSRDAAADRQITAARFAASSVRKLDPRGVDLSALELGNQIAQWYDEGIRVRQQGQYLHRVAGNTAQVGEMRARWREADRRHNAQAEAISRQGNLVRSALRRRYGLDFPPLE